MRSYGPKCRFCGYLEDAAVHLPALTGPRKGLPYDHEFQPGIFTRFVNKDKPAIRSLKEKTPSLSGSETRA